MSANHKIALVTGGGRGLGKNMALKLAQKGLDVIVTYNSKKEDALAVVAQIEQTELEANTGMLPRSESDDAIRHLGVTYQLVTDQTSMIVLDDAAFVRNGIARNNQQRVGLEFQAQNTRASQPPAPHRVDTAKPAFTSPAPHVSHGGGGSGGGALDASTVNFMILVFLITGSVWARRALAQKPKE